MGAKHKKSPPSPSHCSVLSQSKHSYANTCCAKWKGWIKPTPNHLSPNSAAQTHTSRLTSTAPAKKIPREVKRMIQLPRSSAQSSAKGTIETSLLIAIENYNAKSLC